MNKDELRKKYKQIRKDNLPTDNIFNTIITLPEYISARSIAIYYNTKYEVDTKKLIEYSLKQNKEVYLPRVVDKHKMVFIRIYNLDPNNFTTSTFGITEPILDESNTLKDTIDLTIVPGLCFDKKLYRVGYGGGFYDCFLSTHNTFKLGTCYDNQILDGYIETDEHDIKMDMIVTEKRVIK